VLRRTVVQLLGVSPFALGKVGKELYNDGGSKLSSGALAQTAADAPMQAQPVNEATIKAVNKWMKLSPGYRAELRDHINAETHVTYIDADLMAMRSLSTAARIYYMRQRLVDRQVRCQLDEDEERSMWHLREKWRELAVKALGLWP
jgi:hypothetical protein